MGDIKDVIIDISFIRVSVRKIITNAKKHKYMVERKQSQMWPEVLRYIENSPGKRIPNGFPFSVPFPEMYGGRKYEIILVSGEKVFATVDDAREFSSEGLQWKTDSGNKEQAVAAAWKLYSK